ncbi:hypothetical protein E3N88_36097 [Mikania micrantha]|uniref:Uncharacterized protein n=1 Tax=Mikania micrantha TaxID=192012 RepID=A0A5N6M2X4_9ASTR|nr:hypothetical protein E3N88_36097 [Mikania micrantha]
MSMSIKRISEIFPGDPPEALEIRVIKKWRPFTKQQEKMTDICYLLVDSHGDAIEAVVDSNQEEYFQSTISIQSCYTIDKYISIPSRTYMPAIQHRASLRIGKYATIQPLLGKNLPTYYYKFASYKDLPRRMELPKLLTDYIGRIEDVSDIMIRSGKKMRKVIIQDESRNIIEITLWGDKANLIEKRDSMGKILAITSTTVTQFKDKLQLESTTATTTDVNPSIPDLNTYIDRFKNLGETSHHQPREKMVTITEVKSIDIADNLQNRYKCVATVIDIQEHRNWYCVNTMITDDNTNANAVFFNDSMNELLNISCHDLVITHNNRNPKILPEQISAISGIPLLLYFNLKKDGTIAINKAEKVSAFPPSTPDPKMGSARNARQLATHEDSSGKKSKY